MRRRLNGLYVLDPAALDLAYGPDERAGVAALVDVVAPPQTRESVLRHPHLLAEVDVILSGWGAPVLDEAFLARAPRLAGFFYAAGALGGVLTPAAWARGVAVSSAIDANAVPVAEYTLAATLFSLKHGWRLARATRERRDFPDRNGAPGCYGRTVGLVSLGACARALLKLLAPFDLRVLAYDPYVGREAAAALGAELVPLGQLFASCDVVSLHAPLLPETVGLVTGSHLASMRRGAAFINTARGEVVRQAELIAVAARRPDLQFVLDVACPEPPEPASPLYTLPNVVLTPHIAGSVGGECRRMGRFAVEELGRYVSGRPLRGAVTRETADHSSHSPAAARAVDAAAAGAGRPEPAAPPERQPRREAPAGSAGAPRRADVPA